MRGRNLTFAVVVALLGLSVPPLSAEVVRIEVQSRSDLVAGQPFGAAGPYEKIAGKVFFAVDPNVPANKIVPISTRRRATRRGRSSSRRTSTSSSRRTSEGQRRRPVRSLEPRRQGDARLFQSRHGQRQSRTRRQRWAMAS